MYISFQGTIHKGLPQGQEEIVHGLNTYVIGNRNNPQGMIIIYSDIFGLALPNNKLIADAYARSGEWLVYMPDFFKGDPVMLKFADVVIPVDAAKQSSFGFYTGLLASAQSLMMWMMRHKEGLTNKVCIAGFCWGGKYAIRTGLENNMIEMYDKKIPLVDAVVALHPSNLVFPDDVENLVVPVSYGWGLDDIGVKIEQKGKVEKVHAKEEAGRKVPDMEHKIYKPGCHGFAVRGNLDDPMERACLEDLLTQALDWFPRWL
ncbi:hypothetical protein EYZ11_013201 [Aspergillus tanneri]|uniref:Dienelactone hydrolase domain-containing protein n=1 Tax=Aspergillus tanneri TaxID=1220188 RepID=A0A4V3UMH8_9EURO|nr:hypothetical protein EYZ11_013201 [Aspergillus tanneri]